MLNRAVLNFSFVFKVGIHLRVYKGTAFLDINVLLGT
jgi:hypothetical protein